jgi:DNA-binding protein H-NS
MAKRSLTSMTIDALLRLRDDVGAALRQKADGLKKELRSLGQDYADVGRIALYGKSKLAGRKVAPKYQGPNGELWSGRGALPRWMAAEITAGKTREDFLIAKAARKKAPAKKRKARRKKR